MKMIPKGPLRGEITVPGDKSISHRSVLLGALAKAEPGCRDSWRRLIVWPQLIACAYWECPSPLKVLQCLSEGAGWEKYRNQVIF